MATKPDLDIWGGALSDLIRTELARHTRAIEESLSKQIEITISDRKLSETVLRAEHFLPTRRGDTGVDKRPDVLSELPSDVDAWTNELPTSK